MVAPSGSFPQITINRPPVRVGISGLLRTPQTVRLPDGELLVEELDSSPGGRAGAQSANSTSLVTIGAPTDDVARNDRLSAAVAANNQSGGVVTAADANANVSAVQRLKQGVLGCVGATGTTSTSDCNDCSTIDCLAQLLTGNLLNVDAKKLLCDMIASAERAAKSQIDSTGNALLRAAQNLTSAAALKAPLNTLNNFVNALDPGALAKCFGANQLKALISGKLNQVNATITNAENGVHANIASAFNKATQAAQQFSVTPNLCR